MIVAMRSGASDAELRQVIDTIEGMGLKAVSLPGGERVAVGIASSIPPELRDPLTGTLEVLSGVDHVTQVSRAYKLASREFHPVDSVVEIKGVTIGTPTFTIAAGPCAIESREQLLSIATMVKDTGAKILRGGAYKPRTSPYAFQGLGPEGLKYLKEAADATGLVSITEIIDHHDADLIAEYADILQIGARNMQNYALLTAVGKLDVPVMLKRGPSATIDEWLLAAEYILSQGNSKVILCERGLHPVDKTYTRYTLDISAVPVVKSLSHLPVIVDPSHAAGNRAYVPALSYAAAAVGADGLMIEVHNDPAHALCDAPQALALETLRTIINTVPGLCGGKRM
jgi:3-deoxy-7-phosphoheptulonate synthase